MLRSIRRLKSDQKGAIFIFSAVFAPVLIGMSTLIVDIALAYSARSRLEQVASHAASIGAERLPDTASATAIARDMAEDMMRTVNIYSSSPVVTTSSDGSTVTVEIDVVANSFFSGIYSSTGIDVEAKSIWP